MNSTDTPVAITPLLEERTFYLVREGIGYLYGTTLKEHKEYLPRKYVGSYKPFSLYEESPSNPVAKEFIKKGGVYFPEEEWDSYVSLTGSSLLDISFVLENFPNKKLVLNFPYDIEFYQILTSIRDYPEEFINTYQYLINPTRYTSNNRANNQYYKRVKEFYYEGLGDRPVCVNSSILLFLLHTGSSSTPTNIIDTLWQWHKVLTSPLVSLYSTIDYTSIPLPKEGRNFIVANCPESYIGNKDRGWNPATTKIFTSYFNHLRENTNSFLLATANTNPKFRSQFDKKKGWSSYKVISNTPLSSLFYEEKKHRNNTDMCVVSNFPLQLPNTELTPCGRKYTTEYLELYSKYCSSLL